MFREKGYDKEIDELFIIIDKKKEKIEKLKSTKKIKAFLNDNSLKSLRDKRRLIEACIMTVFNWKVVTIAISIYILIEKFLKIFPMSTVVKESINLVIIFIAFIALGIGTVLESNILEKNKKFKIIIGLIDEKIEELENK